FATHLRRMRRLYARRQAECVALCRRELGAWLDVEERDAGMQGVGWLRAPLDDRAVAAAALARGVDVQPVSINYLSDRPRQGLLLGCAALGERALGRAVGGLRAALRGAAATHA